MVLGASFVMHMISYVSDVTANPPVVRNAIIDIVGTAQQKNKSLDVTGVLFFENNHFFQIIEGKEENLRPLYDTIEQDQRHCRITKLLDQPVSARTFNEWSIETFYVDNPSIVTPKTLRLLRELYVENFEVSANGLLEFVTHMVDEMDTFKINKYVNKH